jgi:uncharacterized protein YlxW (UPF0749 family)
MFGPRLLDDRKKLESLSAALWKAEERLDQLDNEVRDLKDRVNKMQLRGVMK